MKFLFPRCDSLCALLAALLFCLTVSFSMSAVADSASNKASVQASAQANGSAAKRPLTHADFDAWQTIATPMLSRDGKWLAYALQPQDGDGELVIRELATGKERRERVGALPPPMTTPDAENPDAPLIPRAIRIVFTSDSRFVVATTYPTKVDTQAARVARKKPEEMPKGGLLIINLGSAEAVRIANVKSMQVPAKGGAWVAYLKEEIRTDAIKTDAAKNEATNAASEIDQAATGATTIADTAAKKKYGTELVLRDLFTGHERSFADVLESSFARDGKTLLFATASKAATDNGVYAIVPQTIASPVVLLSGRGKYTKLVWDREQTQVAFLSNRDDAEAKVPQFKLYLWSRQADAVGNAGEVVSSTTSGFPTGMVVSDKSAVGAVGAVAFSRDGKKLYVPATLPGKLPRAPNAGPTDEEKVVADLWRWNDDQVQPMQKIRALQERNRSYRGVLDLATRRYTQLADETLRSVSLSDDGNRAVGMDDRRYRRLVDYDDNYADLYVINPANGMRKLAVQKFRISGEGGGGGSGAMAQDQWSPDGKWWVVYQNKHWHALDTVDGSLKNLTAKLGVAVYNEEHDTPGPAVPYGSGGWMGDSQSLLIYDRFDVWQIFMDGRAAINLTRGEGRKTQVRLRVQRINPLDEDDEERGIDVSKPLVLRGESDETRATGFFQTGFNLSKAAIGSQAGNASNAGSMPLRRLIWGDKNFRYVGRAQDADRLLLSASRFDTYPDLHITDSTFANTAIATDGVAQMAPFTWGTGKLMSFKNARGVPLKAAVYKPDNFDPRKKYPLMVYIYERLSQNVHNFSNPAPSNGINPALYVSNGYVVLMPDIAYTLGEPGKNALDAVLPAIDALVKQGGIDEKAIGIQGHSWGGYQIAWMVTQTHRFRAAEAGAPVGNMTSAYSGIRWGSGLPRQFQYEQQQSRIGKSLYEAPNVYLANSPIFHITKVQTPLLILANDADDAVPWYQGIELFLALRRHEKEAYLFNYNGQLHNLRRRADQKDFALRMHQYFDHFLKGAAAPEWMQKGIPFNDREEEKERFMKAVVGAAVGGAAPDNTVVTDAAKH